MYDATDGAVAVAEVEPSATDRLNDFPTDPQPIDYVVILQYMVRHAELGRHVRRLGGKDDAFQVGWLALARACETYTPNSGKFSNYAAKAIQRAIIRQSNASGLIRVPESMQRVHKGKRPDQRKGFEDAVRAGRMAFVRFGCGAGRIDVAGEAVEPAADPAEVYGEIVKLCGFMLKQLDKKQHDAICRHFGIGCEPMSLAASGRTEGMTDNAMKARIRRGMKKIRECVDPAQIESLLN